MMRRPTPAARLFAWHTEALRNPDLPRHPDLAECGFYKRRMVRGGPWIPVRIMVEREIDPETGELAGPETLVALVDGRRDDPLRHWTHLRPITKAEFEALQYRQSLIPAMSDTETPMDLTKEPLSWMI